MNNRNNRYIAVTSTYGIISSVMASIIFTKGLKQHKVIAGAIMDIDDYKMLIESREMGLAINEPISINLINPHQVELWLTLDELSHKITNKLITNCDNILLGLFREIVFPPNIYSCDISKLKYPLGSAKELITRLTNYYEQSISNIQ